jgi:phosphopantetheinyl transferase (holo-ACP synthase)
LIIIACMRVLGVGVDLVMNARIEQILTKNYAERFIRKFLHEHELKRYFQM